MICISHYQMSDISIWHCSLRNKVQMSQWRWPQSSSTHSSQQAVQRGCWGQRVSVSKTIHCAFWALIEDILQTIALGVDTGSKFSGVFPSSHPSPTYSMLTITFIVHVLLKCRSTGSLIPRGVCPFQCQNLIYVTKCVCAYVVLNQGDISSKNLRQTKATCYHTAANFMG